MSDSWSILVLGEEVSYFWSINTLYQLLGMFSGGAELTLVLLLLCWWQEAIVAAFQDIVVRWGMCDGVFLNPLTNPSPWSNKFQNSFKKPLKD